MTWSTVGVSHGHDLAAMVVDDLEPNDVRKIGEEEPADVAGLDRVGLGGRFDLRFRVAELLIEPAGCLWATSVIPPMRPLHVVEREPMVINGPSGH
jgi:hypothetical protein